MKCTKFARYLWEQSKELAKMGREYIKRCIRNAIYIAQGAHKRVKSLIDGLVEKVEASDGKLKTQDLVKVIFSFCEIYCAVTMYPYQEQFSKRVIRSVLENDGEEITALFSRQSGKSETVANTTGGLMIILPILANMPMFANDKRLTMFKEGFWCGIFAPALRQSQNTYNRMKSRMQSKSAIQVYEDPEFNLGFSTSNGCEVALTNGSKCTCLSASDGANIEGESFMFIICEECQDISNFKIRKSIHPMGAAYNATIVKIGTATTFKGDFYEAIERNKRRFLNKEIPIKNHFEYDYLVVMKYNPKYEKYVMKEKYRLGEESDEFQMAYCLKWILSRGMFVDIAVLEAKNGVKDAGRIRHETTKNHVAGIDVAVANDDTIITIGDVDWDHPAVHDTMLNPETGKMEEYTCYDTMITDWGEMTSMDYEELYEEIVDYLSHFKISRICIDATREASLAARLRATLPYEVVPVVFSSKVKSEMYKTLDREIKSGRAKFPMDKETVKSREYKKFLQQMGDLQKNYSGSYMVVAHPDERGAHDDYCDSWALMVMAAQKQGKPKVESKPNVFRESVRKQKSNFYTSRNRITARRR